MKASRYVTASILLLSAFLGRAQQSPVPGLYRLRVGLQTASNYYSVFYAGNATRPQSLQVTPALLSVGYAFTPRLGVQVGVAAGRDLRDTPGSTGTTLAGQYQVTGVEHDEQHWLAAPLLLRYALLPPSRRLQFEALAGLTYVYASHSEEVRNTSDGLETLHSYYYSRAAHLYATLGVAVRYGLGRHLEAVGDLSWTRNFHPGSTNDYRLATGNRLGITHGTNVGLRYRFNLPKPKEKA